ncbi:DUF4444 domain-containing protein [Epibacterium ulvae]|uniref:biotin/lipoate--protein ligase family protein n=1 Tax=Epibacterium ulvae TaxID=1156985 RepID=UPI001BFCC9AD|nr:biotin/lipoate--protein ligase family protein [Epibacterium ulvae]MBT8153179.1 DUF4444 domain-containing protein [Epibacterium ulvae]
MTTPTFPPLMSGHALSGQDDPFEVARQKAVLGCEAGLVTYNFGADHMAAALVLAPEVPLTQAIAMLPACGVGFQNAMGALAPPEVAIHFEWGGAIRINGARCGQLRTAAGSPVVDQIPEWLVVGFELRLWPSDAETGLTPDETALFAEGCADISAPALLEAWARHTLHWICRWEEKDGAKSLHGEWRGLLHNLGETTTQGVCSGTFLGVDEHFGMLLRDGEQTHLLPLTDLLEE